MTQNKPDDFSKTARSWMVIGSWVLIFLLLFMLFDKLTKKMNNPNSQVSTQYVGERKHIVLQRNKYGHYVATGSINGQPVTFLVDTGASDVAIPDEIAKRLGLQKGAHYTTQTANGIGSAFGTRLDSISLGEITLHDIRGSILTNAGTDEILLGMTFLKHLELKQKGDELTIIQ